MLLISAELDEIYALSDRILTIYEGRITGEYPPDAPAGGVRHRDARRHGDGGGELMSRGADSLSAPRSPTRRGSIPRSVRASRSSPRS